MNGAKLNAYAKRIVVPRARAIKCTDWDGRGTYQLV